MQLGLTSANNVFSQQLSAEQTAFPQQLQTYGLPLELLKSALPMLNVQQPTVQNAGSTVGVAPTDALKAQGHEVERSQVRMPAGALKQVGDRRFPDPSKAKGGEGDPKLAGGDVPVQVIGDAERRRGICIAIGTQLLRGLRGRQAGQTRQRE